jgi:hypothetical protein
MLIAAPVASAFVSGQGEFYAGIAHTSAHGFSYGDLPLYKWHGNRCPASTAAI